MRKSCFIKRVSAAAMAFAMVGVTSAFAAPVVVENEPIVCNSELVEPRTNFPIIENTPIRNSGVTWEHTAPYIHARVHVYNTTDEVMKVTIKQNGNIYDSFEVQPNDKRTEKYNDLPTGIIKIDFDVESGEVDGIVAVRVSDTRF